MSAPESEMLDELRRRAQAEGAEAVEGEYIPKGEGEPDSSATEAAMLDKLRRMMTGTLRVAFARYAPYWISEDAPEDVRIKPVDIELLGESYIEVLNEYLPWLLAQFPALVGALLTTGMVIGSPMAAGLPRFKPQPPEKPTATDV